MNHLGLPVTQLSHSSKREIDNHIMKTQQELDQVMRIMRSNLEKLAERGEKLDELTLRADALQESTNQFGKTTHTIVRKYRRRPCLYYFCTILSIFTLLVTIYCSQLLFPSVNFCFRPLHLPIVEAQFRNMEYNIGIPRQQMVGHHNYAYQTSAPIQIRDPTPLICNEVLDRSSPELWPEPVPGLVEKNRDNGLQLTTPRTHKFKTEMDQDDVRLVNDLGRLTADQLMEYVKNLQNNAFILGVEEKKQFAKGKFLKIFEKRADEVYS